MSWKRFFTPVDTSGNMSPISGAMGNSSNPSRTNYSSYLPDVYAGHPNRLERYGQYDTMDSDSEVNAALDILAEFCTQENTENGTQFQIFFREQATNTEIKIIKKYMQQWCKLNQFNRRLFKIVRNAFKYGDVFFVRDPETQAWMYVDPAKVDRIIVNESEGKKPEQYHIRDFNPNLETLATTAINPSNLQGGGSTFGGSYGTGQGGAGGSRGMVGAFPTSTNSSRFAQNQNQYAIDAEHVIHISMSEGLDNNYPFGNSLLESIFKVFKQKELLEDAIIIYRVQRAPERRVFYIDVGNMPSHLAMSFVERVKNEVNQRRIPSNTGGSQSVIDSSYNPLSINEDYFFPTTAEGRGSKVEILPGGCFSMDTQVPLLDGRTLSISELADEYSAGKENWVYSTNPQTGRVVPGLISWAGVTQKSAKVVKLTLDNGKEIICTPEHKFPILGKGLVEARDLVIGESFIPFNVKNSEISKFSKQEYTQVYQNDTKKWEFVHRMVVSELYQHGLIENFVFNSVYSDSEKTITHHKNHNRYDNNPFNLVRMNHTDHSEYHAHHGFSKEAQQLGTNAAKEKLKILKETDHESYMKICQSISDRNRVRWASLSDTEYQCVVNNITTGINEYFKNRTPEDRARDYQVRVENFIKGNKKLQTLLLDDAFKERFSDSIKTGWDLYKGSDSYFERNQKISNANALCHQTVGYTESIFEKERVQFSKEILDRVQSLCKGKTTHQYTRDDLANDLNNDPEILSKFISINNNGSKPNFNPHDGFKTHHFAMMVKQHGYTGWKQFRKECEFYNHKLVKIELLSDSIEVGTLTIDQDELYHDYHNFALDVGIFGQNSNLGEIDDLKYFTNKLFRALRIPSSYLPTSADDGGSNFNDGRVGTAYIQELRFNKYCERLQNMINNTIDLEFKLYLHNKGINVDNNIFDIKFNPPQNFASYRQAEMDTARVNTFSTMIAIPFVSKRFAMKRFLGLTAEEVAENETLWQDENVDIDKSLSPSAELRSVGITANGIAGDLAGMSAPPEPLPSDLEEPPGGLAAAPSPQAPPSPT